MIKKIYTILVLIKNLIFRKKYYTLSFIAEIDPPVKRWYYDFKHWGFSKDNLEMVSGADSLCEAYAKGKNKVTVNIIATNKQLPIDKTKEYDMFVGEMFPKEYTLKDKLLYGRNYTATKEILENLKVKTIIVTMWICPVTLFVLGRYPNFIYIKRNNLDNKKIRNIR